MTFDEVKAAVEDVRRQARDHDDDERAHSHEDQLHVAVLRAIASGELGHAQARLFAAEALKTCEIQFHRWCA